MWPFRSRKGGNAEQTPALGRRGEQLARRHLKSAGYKILADNFRCPGGEIDLIALDTSTRKASGSDTIAFIEVKTRVSEAFAPPEAAVNPHKQRRIRHAAGYYLSTRGRSAAELAVRFDVVAIVAPPGQPPQVRHIIDAF